MSRSGGNAILFLRGEAAHLVPPCAKRMVVNSRRGPPAIRAQPQNQRPTALKSIL